MTAFVMAFVVVLVLGLAIFFLALTHFVRGRSDELLVVTGKISGGKSAKILHGGLTFIWPILQSYSWLPLAPRTINLELKGALSSENIRVNLPCAFIVAVDGNNQQIMETAAIRILPLVNDDRKFDRFIEDLLFGQMRSVISTMTIEAINADRQKFQDNIVNSVSRELAKVGLQLLSINIKDIQDEAHYIENLGKKAAAEAQAKARVAIAEQNKIGQSGESAYDAERRQVVADNNLLAISAENAAAIGVAESNAQLDKKSRETVAVNASEAAITVSNAEKEAELVKADNERKIYEARKVAAKAQEEMEVAIARVSASPQAEKLVIQKRSEGQAEGELALERMRREAEGVKSLLMAKAEGVARLVEAAGGDPMAAAILSINDELPGILKDFARSIENRKIDNLVCVGGNGGGLPELTSSLVNQIPALRDIFKSFGYELPVLRKINEKTESEKMEKISRKRFSGRTESNNIHSGN